MSLCFIIYSRNTHTVVYNVDLIFYSPCIFIYYGDQCDVHHTTLWLHSGHLQYIYKDLNMCRWSYNTKGTVKTTMEVIVIQYSYYKMS